jgi:hypothetical protein
MKAKGKDDAVDIEKFHALRRIQLVSASQDG